MSDRLEDRACMHFLFKVCHHQKGGDCRSKLHDDEPSNFDDAKSPSNWLKIDSILQDQASRIKSKIKDSREEIKKQQVKISYRISIKRFFQKPNSTILFYKRIFSNFLSY